MALLLCPFSLSLCFYNPISSQVGRFFQSSCFGSPLNTYGLSHETRAVFLMRGCRKRSVFKKKHMYETVSDRLKDWFDQNIYIFILTPAIIVYYRLQGDFHLIRKHQCLINKIHKLQIHLWPLMTLIYILTLLLYVHFTHWPVGPVTIRLSLFLMFSLSFSSHQLSSHGTRGQDPVAIKHDGKEKAGAEMIPFHAE